MSSWERLVTMAARYCCSVMGVEGMERDPVVAFEEGDGMDA